MSDIVGIAIGRFQVADLHEGHRYLINEAFRNHKKVIILVGCSPIQGTKHDPLDYPTRERMLRAAYPDAIILPIFDCLDDKEWSANVDRAIRGVVPNLSGAYLYGGRDSFSSHYHGDFTPIAVEGGIQYQSGTGQREDIGKVVRSSSDFRAGIIYSTQNAWPYTKMCVDIACIKKNPSKGYNKNFGDDKPCKCGHPYYRHFDSYDDMHHVGCKYCECYDFDGPDSETKVLLGRKNGENKWRLIGGMVDKGESLESSAKRELAEETNLDYDRDEVSEFTYVGSAPVGDWRFKHAGEIGILTALFIAEYKHGEPKPQDDIVEVKWFSLKEAEEAVIKGHKVLIKMIEDI